MDPFRYAAEGPPMRGAPRFVCVIMGGVNGALARTAGALAGAGVVAGLVYWPVWLHRHDPPPPSLTRRPADVVLADVPNATLVGRDRGRKVWQIHARHVQAAVDGHTATFIGVDRGTLFRNNRPAAHVSAGRVAYNNYTRSLQASGGLRLSSGGLSVATRRLSWSAVTGAVRCPDPVTVVWPAGAARAESLTADTHLQLISGRHVCVTAQLDASVNQHLARAATGATLALALVSPASAAEPSYKEVRLRGDSWRYDHATGAHVYKGHIIASQGDTTVHADEAIYNEKANTASVRGHITVDNPRAHAEGDTAEVNFNTRAISLRGEKGVRIIARPKPAIDGKPATGLQAGLKEPAIIDCRGVDYFYREKRAEAFGPVTVTSKGRTVSGRQATYQASQDLITITGNVRGRDEKGQTFEAPTVKVYVKEGAEWMEAPNVSATFHIKEEEETPSAGSKRP